MKMYTQKYNRGKGNVSNIPNTIAYTFIRNYMTSKEETKTFKIKEIHLFLDTCIIVTKCNEKIAIRDLTKW